MVASIAASRVNTHVGIRSMAMTRSMGMDTRTRRQQSPVQTRPPLTPLSAPLTPYPTENLACQRDS